MTSKELLEQLIQLGNQLNETIQHDLVPLTPFQLNWKPDLKSWSIAECLDHLNIGNKQYFPIIERALYTVKAKPEFQEVDEPFQHTLTGNMMIKMVKPENRKKVRAPRLVAPSRSIYDNTIVPSFLDQHKTFMYFLQESVGLNLAKVKVYSPANRVFKFNIGDCYAMIQYHNERHIQQLQRVMQHASFPTV